MRERGLDGRVILKCTLNKKNGEWGMTWNDKWRAVVNTVMNRGVSTDFEEGIQPKIYKSICQNLPFCSEIAVMDCTVGKNKICPY